MREIKQSYTDFTIQNRMIKALENLHSQGCYKVRTFVDVDSIVGLQCVKQALFVKDYVKNHFGMQLQLATQPLEGLQTDSNIKLFENAAKLCDIVGCLPNRDGDNMDKHFDVAFKTAKKLNKPIEAHLDQCNIPEEKETAMFCTYVKAYQMQGNARAIHSISLACQSKAYQTMVAKQLADLDIGVIVCPSAAISMTQHSEKQAPIHNSIAPVKLLLENGVKIGLGVDNIEDVFMPLCDGDLEFELRTLAESARLYDPDILKQIAENEMGFEQMRN